MTGSANSRGASLAAASVIMAVLGLAGCSGSGEPIAPSSGPSPTATEPADGKIQSPAELQKGWQGVASDVTIESCPLEKGKVTATGKVVNSADEPRDIALLISWNRPDSTDTMLQLSTTEANVPAGKTVEWSVSGSLPADAGQCILNARSGQVED